MICVHNKINKDGFLLPCLTQCPGNIRRTYLMQKNTALPFFSVGQFLSCHALNIAHIVAYNYLFYYAGGNCWIVILIIRDATFRCIEQTAGQLELHCFKGYNETPPCV